jgi:hypothetical protein
MSRSFSLPARFAISNSVHRRSLDSLGLREAQHQCRNPPELINSIISTAIGMIANESANHASFNWLAIGLDFKDGEADRSTVLGSSDANLI